jgi:hypothetical protein
LTIIADTRVAPAFFPTFYSLSHAEALGEVVV